MKLIVRLDQMTLNCPLGNRPVLLRGLPMMHWVLLLYQHLFTLCCLMRGGRRGFFLPSPPTKCLSLNLVLPEVACWKGVFPCHCHQVFAYSAYTDYWGFLSIIVWSLPYNIKPHKVSVVNWHYINERELNLILGITVMLKKKKLQIKSFPSVTISNFKYYLIFLHFSSFLIFYTIYFLFN